ncbi:nitroreductase family protein [Saccharothrix violaceirubra]|nr:nitroreductase family protein [Saccharothrix violaceirubra]
MHPLISGRTSPRTFADAPVDVESMRVLFEAARWAPSHGNSQPARFLLGYSGDAVHERLLAVLRPKNRAWASAAPVLFAGLVMTVNEKGPLPNAEYGLGLAVENLALQAVDLGLVTHQMGGFDADALVAAFGLPPEVRPVVVVAVGRPGAPEGRERVRLPLSGTVFGEWGTPAF